MKKLLLAALAALAVAFPVLATTTWAEIETSAFSNVRGVTATCTTGSEAAPSAATAGLGLRGLKGLSVTVETASGGNMTAAGKLVAYVYNPTSSSWAPVSDGTLDLTVSAVPKQAFSGFSVTADYGRIAWEPSGVGTAVTVYIVGATK